MSRNVASARSACSDPVGLCGLDAMWLARLTQWGMLRPSLVPPAAIRRVRRPLHPGPQDLVRERTRCLQRLEDASAA